MYGMNENGFTIKRLPQIKSDLEEAARTALGSTATLLPDSVEGQIISVFSEIFAEMWEQLEASYSAFNPIAVTGQSLDNLALLNGITRLPPIPSRAFLSITGDNFTVIPAGSVVKHNGTSAEFLTEKAVEIGVGFPSGTATVFASSRFNGSIEALSGTLTIIDSPINGWNTVINNTDAELGRLEEVDSQLRARRARSLALSGNSSLESIISALQGIAGVTHAGIVENFTDVPDAFGIPAHAFEAVVLGGTDIAIAQAIWEKKPVGIQPHGDVQANANDIFGNVHEMSFSRPAQIPIWVNADVTFIGKVPDDASVVLTQSILDFVSGGLVPGQSLSVGDDVINSRLYMPFNLTYGNMTISSLTTSIDGITYNSNDIPIEFNELSIWDAIRINIVVG